MAIAAPTTTFSGRRTEISSLGFGGSRQRSDQIAIPDRGTEHFCADIALADHGATELADRGHDDGADRSQNGRLRSAAAR